MNHNCAINSIFFIILQLLVILFANIQTIFHLYPVIYIIRPFFCPFTFHYISPFSLSSCSPMANALLISSPFLNSTWSSDSRICCSSAIVYRFIVIFCLQIYKKYQILSYFCAFLLEKELNRCLSHKYCVFLQEKINYEFARSRKCH